MVGPVYIRLGRAAVPTVYAENDDIKIGKANCLLDGTDYTVIATGIMVNEALIAAQELKKDGISVKVIDMHSIKPIDEEAVIAAAKATKGIVTAEEHSVIGGLGAAVAQVCAENYPTKMAFVGQLDTFGESGKPDQLKEKYHMTATDIVNAVRTLAK